MGPAGRDHVTSRVLRRSDRQARSGRSLNQRGPPPRAAAGRGRRQETTHQERGARNAYGERAQLLVWARAGRGGKPRVVAGSLVQTRRRVRGSSGPRRNRRSSPTFASGMGGPATATRGLPAPCAAIANLRVSLGVEGRRRSRVGEHPVTLENDRDRQQEPASFLPRMTS